MSSKTQDRHHIIPKSRCRELGINPKFSGNVVTITTGKHRAWHQLFGNKTPIEAIALIEAEWSLSAERTSRIQKTVRQSSCLMQRSTNSKSKKEKQRGGTTQMNCNLCRETHCRNDADRVERRQFSSRLYR